MVTATRGGAATAAAGTEETTADPAAAATDPPEAELTLDQVMEQLVETNPYSILVFHKNEDGSRSSLSKFGWTKIFKWLSTEIIHMELAAEGNSDQMVRLAAHGYHKDHGVLVPRDKESMLLLIQLLPKVGDFGHNEAGELVTIPGFEGKPVAGWPVRDPHTNAILEPTSVVLRLWFPESLVDHTMEIQTYLNASLRKSGIRDGTEAFRGAEAFYWDPKNKNILCFLAQYVTVVAIMSDRRQDYGCAPGRLYAGLTAVPVYYRNKKLISSRDLKFGHFALAPSYWPKTSGDDDDGEEV